jgi:hypothetical protein
VQLNKKILFKLKLDVGKDGPKTLEIREGDNYLEIAKNFALVNNLA